MDDPDTLIFILSTIINWVSAARGYGIKGLVDHSLLEIERTEYEKRSRII